MKYINLILWSIVFICACAENNYEKKSPANKIVDGMTPDLTSIDKPNEIEREFIVLVVMNEGSIIKLVPEVESKKIIESTKFDIKSIELSNLITECEKYYFILKPFRGYPSDKLNSILDMLSSCRAVPDKMFKYERDYIKGEYNIE